MIDPLYSARGAREVEIRQSQVTFKASSEIMKQFVK